MAQQAINSYMKNQIATAKKSQLVLMLYDGLVRFGKQAIEKIDAGELEEGHNLLVRMQKILAELMSCLNFDVDDDLCKNLLALYNFMYLHLVDANLEHDTKKIEEVLGLMNTLRDTWVEAMKNAEEETKDAGVRTGIAVSG